MIAFIKKLVVFFFSDNPYRIKSFQELFKDEPGSAIDISEVKSIILKKETGKAIVYHVSPVFLNMPPVFRKVNHENRYELKGLFRAPDRYVYKLLNGVILGNTGLVYDKKSRAFIEESAKDWTLNLKDSPYTNLVYFPKKVNLKGFVFSCLTNGAEGGFYHFIFESLLKFSYFKETIEMANFILINGPSTEWKLQWLYKAGVDTQKVIWVMDTDHIECEQLIFTNRLLKDQQISCWCINELRNLFQSESFIPTGTGKETKMIWITRQGLQKRDLIWEKQILQQFTAIERIDFSKMTPAETINAIKKATHILSPHGAGLSNIYFCNKGTKILEILPDGESFQPCYSRISSLLNLEHFIINLDFKNAEGTNHGIEHFRKVLQQFI